MKVKGVVLTCLILVSMMLSGCVSGSPQGRVAMVDPSERSHLDNTLNMTDMLSLAEKLTNKMLMSDAVAEWGDRRPRLIVAKLVNETDVDNIPEDVIYDQIKGLILESGVARIVGPTSNNFDYILHGVLSSTQQYGGDGSSVRHFRITLNLSTIDDEAIGRWHDQISLAKASRPLF